MSMNHQKPEYDIPRCRYWRGKKQLATNAETILWGMVQLYVPDVGLVLTFVFQAAQKAEGLTVLKRTVRLLGFVCCGVHADRFFFGETEGKQVYSIVCIIFMFGKEGILLLGFVLVVQVLFSI